MAVKQLPKISDIPEPPDRLVGDQERFDVLTFNSLKAQKKMVNEDLNKTLIPALNEFAVDVNASVDAAALSERNAAASEQVAVSKAGEAAGSARAAKVSEDNAKVSEKSAAASKTAAAKSAADAEAARTAAEAARDEAQDLANVGYASEAHAGLAKVDGETIRSDATGKLSIVQTVMNLITGSVQKTRKVIAGTGLSGGGALSGDVTLSVKLTDSVATTDSARAASATAVKTAYDRGTAGITAAGTAQSAAATAQSTANNALSVANGKALGGYGLGYVQGRKVHDANDALQAGWWVPENNQDTLNFYDMNHPCLVIPRSEWGTAQVQFVHGKIAIRELWDSKWEPWVLASVGYADTAGVADKSKGLGGHSFIDVFPVGNLGWILGLDVANDQLRPFPPDKVSVGHATTAGSANFATTATFARDNVQGAIGSVATGNNGDKLPAGGTWRVAIIRRGYGGDAGWWTTSPANSLGYAAGGTTVSGGGTNGYDWLAVKAAL